MSNSLQRIISAIVLILLVGLFFYLGNTSFSVLFAIVGLIVGDEISVNFLKRNRDLIYWGKQIFFSALFFLLFFFGSPLLTNVISLIAVIMNLMALGFLFTNDFDDKAQHFFKRFFFIIPTFFWLSLISIGTILHDEDWRKIFIYLLLINFSMDTGAWFFGINFGKHKLWPKVSPKKTREGALGGILITALFALVYAFIAGPKEHWPFFVAASIPFAILSQLGDLFQSKIKRIFDLKDSSSLIPGHGGVYDRIDSLIFLGPFFVLLLTFFNFF